MRLSDLFKLEAFDSSGASLGHVRDVRLEQHDDSWQVVALIVGPAGVAERLGFAHGVVERPVILAKVMHWIGRHARVVPWDKVTVQRGVISVDATRQELATPRSGGD